MLLALEGIDAAGKSTLGPRLADLLAERDGLRAEIWRKTGWSDADDVVAERMAGLYRLIWGGGEPVRDRMGARHHLLLHAAWFDGVYRHRMARLREHPERLAIADGWYHRSIVKAMLREGIAEEWCRSLFEPTARPDAVILLDVDPTVAWERRGGRFTASELGRWDGHDGSPREAFCAYQGRVGVLLRTFAEQAGWIIVRPDAGWSENDVTEAAYTGFARWRAGQADRIHRAETPGHVGRNR